MLNWKACVDEGHISFAENIKILLCQQDEAIFNVLDFDDEAIYADPLFYALFNNNDAKHLESEAINYLKSALIFGYAGNPSFQENGVLVKTDAHGRIYIPRHGWIETRIPDTVFTMKKAGNELTLLSAGHRCDFRLTPPVILPGTDIELLIYPHELFAQFFEDDVFPQTDFVRATQKFRGHLEKALVLMAANCPDCFELVNLVTGKIVIFNTSPDNTNSFMARSAYGAAFLNAYQEGYNEIHFIDDVAHQSGHIVFEAVIYDRDRYFKNNYLDLLKLKNDAGRPVEVILHGMFTYKQILYCLSKCLENNVLSGDKMAEAKARIAFYLDKFNTDLHLLNPEVARFYCTDEGMEIYNDFSRFFTRTNETWGYLMKQYSLKNQPYNFDFTIFKQDNPAVTTGLLTEA